MSSLDLLNPFFFQIKGVIFPTLTSFIIIHNRIITYPWQGGAVAIKEEAEESGQGDDGDFSMAIDSSYSFANNSFSNLNYGVEMNRYLASDVQRPINLNVGGISYCSSFETLTK